MKKTIKVEALKIKVNGMLLASQGTGTNMVREGYIVLLEDILHETDNYAGFRYLDKKDMEQNKGDNELPGVNFDDNGMVMDMEVRFVNTDDTRRYYF